MNRRCRCIVLAVVPWVLTDNEPAATFHARNGWTNYGTVNSDTILGVEIQEASFTRETVGL